MNPLKGSPANEIRWLEDIVDDAKRGEWKSASQKARRMMMDQVKQ